MVRINSSASSTDCAPISSATLRDRRLDRHARLTQISIRSSASGQAQLDRLLALGGAVADVEDRRVEAGTGGDDADEQLDDRRLLGQSAQQEDIDRSAAPRRRRAAPGGRTGSGSAGSARGSRRPSAWLRRTVVGKRAPADRAGRRWCACRSTAPRAGPCGGGRPRRPAGRAASRATRRARARRISSRVFSVLPEERRHHREEGGEDARCRPAGAIRNAGSVRALTTDAVMAGCPQTSKFIILRMTKMPIDIQTPETPRMRWPVLVVNSGMM